MPSDHHLIVARFWTRYRKTATTPMCYVEDHKDVELALDDLNGHMGICDWRARFEPQNTPAPHARILTREGAFTCEYPFWLALDAQGGLYCIRPDAFDASYDPRFLGTFRREPAQSADGASE